VYLNRPFALSDSEDTRRCMLLETDFESFIYFERLKIAGAESSSGFERILIVQFIQTSERLELDRCVE
jgi:hypothetical protein